MLGDNGIITKAQEARENMELVQIEEQVTLNEAAEYLENIETETPTTTETVVKLKEEGTYTSSKTTVEDSSGNKIVIPEGFKIAEDSGINVTEGIVIEDNDIIEGIGNNRGNQYVWIPVGSNIKKSDGTEINITLGRYIFADGKSHVDVEGNILAIGTPILKQNADAYEDETEIKFSEIDTSSTATHGYKELVASRTGVAISVKIGLNTTALNLKGFIDSVKTNGGYYIARYEASYGADKKANSKVSNLLDTSNGSNSESITEGTLWGNITQIKAATACRELYETVTTDLINSYAWDTAIVYIQEFSGDTDYSRQDGKSINSSLTNTGVNGDEVCKINDMASNTSEWTTEYSTYSYDSYDYPCTRRGGYCSIYSSDCTSSRKDGGALSGYSSYYTFRSTLYM